MSQFSLQAVWCGLVLFCDVIHKVSEAVDEC